MIRFHVVFVFIIFIRIEVQQDIEHDIKFSWVQSDKKKVAEREATPVVRIVCVVYIVYDSYMMHCTKNVEPLWQDFLYK